MPFADEAGHLLGALALHAGDRLYTSYVDAHGPLVFMLTQAYGSVTGWGDLTYARVIQTIFAWLGCLAILCSPALANLPLKCLGAALFLGILRSVWIVQWLYMDNYHTLGGTLIVMALALVVVPCWQGVHVSRVAAAAAGLCLALATGASYSYAPACILLLGSAIAAAPACARNILVWCGLGFAAGFLGVACWLWAYGDFAGYLVFHVVANQLYYAPYIHFSFFTFLRGFTPRSGVPVPHLIGLACFYVTSAAALARYGTSRRRGGAVILGLIGIVLLNARGSTGFPDGAFLVASIGFAAIVIPAVFLNEQRPVRMRTSVGITIGLIVAAQLAVLGHRLSPAEAASVQPWHYRPDNQPISQEIRRIMGPGERLLVLVYNPTLYLSAGRLPMRKYHAYLPWEADYAAHPLFGRDRDLCTDLHRDAPKIIYFDNWTVWHKYEPRQFIPCLDGILANDYSTDPGFPLLHIRNP